MIWTSKKLNCYKITVAFTLILLAILGGCTGFSGTDSPIPAQTNSTTTDIPETTASPTATAIPTDTATETERLPSKQKLQFFTDNYTSSIEKNGVNVTNTTVIGEDEQLALTYQMANLDNDSRIGNERENVSLMYAAMAEVYLDRGFGESWIPKQVNITAVTPEGERYETAYTTFERAKMMIDGDISERRYLLEYYGTIEPGPANPEYEG